MGWMDGSDSPAGINSGYSSGNPSNPSPPRIVLILNPAAGRGEGRRRKAELESELRKADCNWQIVETTASGSATQQAAKAARDGADIVAAVGGDGTLNEVMRGILGTQSALGLIPLGTGNDFGRHMGIGRDLAAAVKVLVAGHRISVDVGMANGNPFINVAGCGFDAVVAERINAGYRMLRGTPAYLAAVVACLLKYRAIPMRLTLDGEKVEAKAMLCSIANASSYGGGMRIAPSASVTDGFFDVCILHEVGKLEFLRAFPKVFKGTHTAHPKMEIRRAASVLIETNEPMSILIDGELRGMTPCEFTIMPRALDFVRPDAEIYGLGPPASLPFPP